MLPSLGRILGKFHVPAADNSLNSDCGDLTLQSLISNISCTRDCLIFTALSYPRRFVTSIDNRRIRRIWPQILVRTGSINLDYCAFLSLSSLTLNLSPRPSPSSCDSRDGAANRRYRGNDTHAAGEKLERDLWLVIARIYINIELRRTVMKKKSS